jgi:anaerobic ribonucleoside-triphosphate reductase
LSNRIIQQTLEGLSVSAMPRVRTTDGHLLDWDRDAIAKQLLKETKLSEQFYKVPSITEEEAKDIAREVERRVRWMNVKYLSGPLVREIMNVVLLERHHPEWRNICTRVGTPVFDAHLIDIGTGFESKENANLQENAETSHKKKADKISKEQYLLLLPPYLADHHLAGDLHIHDLEYFGTRPFCLDGSTEVLASVDIDVGLGSTNGAATVIKIKIPLQIKLKDIHFGKGDAVFAPHGLSVLTPKGYRRIIKATRREVKEGELLRIQTTSGKLILATKEHRIPIKTPRGMEIRPAGDLSMGDVLYSMADFDLKSGEFDSLPGDETICRIELAEPSGRYVYDLFVEGDGTEESHTFFTSEGLLIHNCQDWDLRYFFYYGLMPDGLGTKASVAGPAKKPEVAMLHAVKALGSAQTNFAGGQGFYNFLTFIAPYLEGLEYGEIKQLMQMFVYEMTQMMVARGGQLVFSSVQLTPGVPTLWKDKPAVYAGKVWDGVSAEKRTYGQFEREVRLAFKALMEVMLSGDHWGKPFNFPKPEISIEPDFMKEDVEFNTAHPELPTYQDLYLLTFKLAAEYGTPYFDNQLPAYRGAGKGISCYQCLAGEELVRIVGDGGEIRVRQISELFLEAANEGTVIDPDGVEFARYPARTPSINFETSRASLRPFSGVMRKSYRGKLLKIYLASGKCIKVTPDHPVFTLEGDEFEERRACELLVGDIMPVLKEAHFDDKLSDNPDSDIYPSEITKIEEEEYEGYVYDLVDVSDTHNFCNSMGIVTGNCCAYQFAATYDSDSTFDEKLHFKDGMHFSMGSWQVVSLNCPRAAYLARGDDELLFEYLRELMDTSVEIFKVKREWMNQILKSHRMPFATQQPRDPITGERGSVAVGLEGLVYTIGVVGVNEMVQFHTGQQMHESRDAWKLAVRAMTEMEIYAKKLSAQHGMTIALARTPAETTAQRFAVSDLIHEEFRECAERVVKGDLQSVKNLQRTRDLPVYYTNGTHLPPSADVPIFERARLEHVFFPIVDGGNIFHIFMGEATPDPQGLMDFGMRLARETQVGYFTFTKDMTVCLGCYKVSPGLKDNCPNCGSSEVDHISRITGYLQAVSGWNSAKRQELKDRKRYNDLA